MNEVLKLSLTISMALVLGIASMWCWNYGLGRESRAHDQLALNEAAIAVCVDDYRSVYRIRGNDYFALDICTAVMAGSEVL